jgi:hypothetical protein
MISLGDHPVLFGALFTPFYLFGLVVVGQFLKRHSAPNNNLERLVATIATIVATAYLLAGLILEMESIRPYVRGPVMPFIVALNAAAVAFLGKLLFKS